MINHFADDTPITDEIMSALGDADGHIHCWGIGMTSTTICLDYVGMSTEKLVMVRSPLMGLQLAVVGCHTVGDLKSLYRLLKDKDLKADSG